MDIITQPVLVSRLQDEFDLPDGKPPQTLALTGQVLVKSNDGDSLDAFREAVQILQYACTSCRVLTQGSKCCLRLCKNYVCTMGSSWKGIEAFDWSLCHDQGWCVNQTMSGMEAKSTNSLLAVDQILNWIFCKYWQSAWHFWFLNFSWVMSFVFVKWKSMLWCCWWSCGCIRLALYLPRVTVMWLQVQLPAIHHHSEANFAFLCSLEGCIIPWIPQLYSMLGKNFSSNANKSNEQSST